MDEVFDGQCQCGAVCYRVTGRSLTCFLCHCTECKRQSASAFGMALWVEHCAIEVTGPIAIWVRRMPSGHKMRCEFCQVCGVRVFHRVQDQPHIISIKPGTLRDHGLLRPVGHIWTQRALPWVEHETSPVTYCENPDNFDALCDAWQAQLTAAASSVNAPPRASNPSREIQRGDLFWMAEDESRGPPAPYSHPHLVVQDDLFNQSRISTVVVCALTTRLSKAREPGNVLLDAGEGGLPKQSVIVVSQLSSVERSRLTDRIGSLSAERVEQAIAGLRFIQRAFMQRR